MKKLVAPNGEKHGLVAKLANSVPNHEYKHMNEANKAKLEKIRKEDSVKVKVRYINRKGNHERLTMPYCQYAGDPIELWNFIPNEEYEVWKGLVKVVNDPNKRLRKRTDLIGPDEKPLVREEFYDPIHEFVPVNF